MTRIHILLAVILLSVMPAIAKTVTVTLVDGSNMTGTVIKQYEDRIVIKTIGGTLEISNSDIKAIEVTQTAIEKYNRRFKNKTFRTASAHLTVAQWCKKNNLRTQYFWHLNEAIKIDPDHEESHRALGHERYQKKWIENGVIKSKEIWVSKKEREQLKLEEARLAEQVKKRKAEVKLGIQRKSSGRQKALKPVKLHAWERDFFMKYIPDLDSKDWRKRGIAIKTLVSQKFSHKVPSLLMEVINTGSDLSRQSAIEALSMMDCPGAIPLLEEKALGDPSGPVRGRAASALGKIGGSTSVPVLLKALDDKDKDVVDEAIRALERMTFTSFDYLGSPDIAKAKEVFEGWLHKNAGKSRKEILIDVMQHGSDMDRIKACDILYKAGDVEVMHTLVELLSAKDNDTQAEANRKLMEFSGQDFEFDPYTTSDKLKAGWIEKWKKWVHTEVTKARAGAYSKPLSGKAAIKSNELVASLVKGSRQQAEEQILSMKKEYAIPLLINGLNHGDFYVRVAVFSLLKRVSEVPESFGYDPSEENEAVRLNFISKWETWFTENRGKFEHK